MDGETNQHLEKKLYRFYLRSNPEILVGDKIRPVFDLVAGGVRQEGVDVSKNDDGKSHVNGQITPHLPAT